MRYLEIQRLEEIDVAAFRARKPYPWATTEDLLTPEGFEKLRQNLPDLSLFERRFNESRKGGQLPHDRYSLEYTDDVRVPEPWREFIDELRGKRYRDLMRRLLGGRRVEFRFHWHYTPRSCAVSPHCDAKRELGSHLFYFNTEEDWDPSWGGQTLVLDDGGRFQPRSAPTFDDFERIITVESMDNRSFFFARRDNGWHGVREIRCPEGYLRKVFIVVVNPSTLYYHIRDRIKGKAIQRY
jgi:hypothetical protein